MKPPLDGLRPRQHLPVVGTFSSPAHVITTSLACHGRELNGFLLGPLLCSASQRARGGTGRRRGRCGRATEVHRDEQSSGTRGGRCRGANRAGRLQRSVGARRRALTEGLTEGRWLQEDGDDAVKQLEMLMSAKTTRGGGARARNHPARVHGMPERWSPRALVHTVSQAMPNDVWGGVLPG